MSNPYGIPGGSDIDYDYSKLSPMLGLIDTDRPDYIGQATGPKKWNERMTHNCAVVYLTGEFFPSCAKCRFDCGRCLRRLYGLEKSSECCHEDPSQ